jgi:hypothetical protein
VQPKTLEATIVHQADLLDAEADKFAQMKGEGGSFTWLPLLKRSVYIRKYAEGEFCEEDVPF